MFLNNVQKSKQVDLKYNNKMDYNIVIVIAIDNVVIKVTIWYQWTYNKWSLQNKKKDYRGINGTVLDINTWKTLALSVTNKIFNLERQKILVEYILK